MHTHALIFIQDLALIMLVAGIMTVLCHRFKQPIAFGYIIAGIILGPHTPSAVFIENETIIKTLAELGVIFLMFSLGLEFNLRKLSKVGLAACVPAAFEIVLMVWVGYAIGRLFGWAEIDSLFLGAILSISSSTIIVKALSDLGLKQKPFSQFIFGILIIEDIFAVLILVLLSSVATTGTLQASSVLFTIMQLSAFLVVSLLLGILIVPKLLAYIAKFKSDEMMLISVLGLCFGFCYLVIMFNYSVALGAFVIGAIVAESRQLSQIETLIQPIRDMFSAIFFVSVGLMFNPSVLAEYPIPIAIIITAIVFGKVITCSLGALITGRDGKTSLRIGMGLAQIGEFSFIIAALGISLQVTGDFLYSITVAASIVTTILTPYLIRYSDHVARGINVLVPERIATISNIYITWIKNLKPQDTEEGLMHRVKQTILFILINLTVVIAIFLSGVYLAQSDFGEQLINVANESVRDSIIWSLAVLFSLPFLIAVLRKVSQLSIMIAKIEVKENVNERYNAKVRKLVAQIIPVVAILGIAVLISALSVGILPPLELLGMIAVAIVVLTAILYPWIVKLHTKLRANLLQSLNSDD